MRSSREATVRFLTGVRGRRLLLLALLAYAAVGTSVWIRKTEDFGGYLWVGESVLARRHIYAEPPVGVQNTWPPFFSLLLTPLVPLDRVSPYLSRGLWIAGNLLCLAYLLRVLTRLVHGKELRLAAETDAMSLAAPEVLVPLLLTDRFVTTNFDHLQINVLLFALVLCGLVLASRSREVAGGLAVGLASAVKLMPLAFVPYLVFRRRFLAAGVAVLSFLLLSVSPILVFGKARFLEYLSDYREVMEVGRWGVGKMNQSVFAMVDRLLGHGFGPLAAPGTNIVLPSARMGASLAATGALLTAVAFVALVAFLRPQAPGSRAMLSEWAVVFLVAALFGPVSSWKAYLVVLLIPNMLLFALWRREDAPPGQRKAAGWLLVVASVLGWIASPGLVGKDLAGRLEMSSVVTVSALVLLGAMLWMRGVVEARHDASS